MSERDGCVADLDTILEFSRRGVPDHFQPLSAHQGKVVDYTTIWLSFNFVSPNMTLSSLCGEWQLRVTHTPLPFTEHVFESVASTLRAEHLGPRKVTWLDNLVTGGALAPVSDRSPRSLPSDGSEKVRDADRTLPPGRSSTKARPLTPCFKKLAGCQAGG